MVALLFFTYVAVWGAVNPSGAPADETAPTWMEKLRAFPKIMQVIALIGAVMMSIYFGWATATEAAALGVLGSLLIALLTGSLSVTTFFDSLMGATRTTSMIGLILAGASGFSVAMGFVGLPEALAVAIRDLNLSPYALLAVLTIFFVILGCFLDGISVVVLSSAVILPMVEAAGIDLLWLGIFVVLVYVLSGDMWVGSDENGEGGEKFVANGYCCRPPHVPHGFFRTEEGCLLLEQHYYDPQ